MNAKKMLIGLVTATVLMTPFAAIQPASATNNLANSTVSPIDGQPEMLMAKGGKIKLGKSKGSGKDKKQEHTSNARPSSKQKHEKGQAAKKNAQENKKFQKAKTKSKYSKLSKQTIDKLQKAKNKKK